MWQLNSLYQEVKEALFSFHGMVSAEAARFYQHPVETATAWYGQAVEYGSHVYASVSEQMLPRAEAAYQQVVADVIEFGHQTGKFWQAFYENPEAVTVSLMEPVSARVDSMINASEFYISSSLEATEAYLIGLYSALVDLFNLLLEQPGATLTALYQNTLSALLDVYFELVSSLLSLL